jgi:hypothetical protein
VRKDNYIDVYYNGGGVIKELKYSKNGYSGLIHCKYLFLKRQSILNVILPKRE